MKIFQPVTFCFIILLFCNSCAKLDINEIRDLKRTSFEPLVIKPGYEANNLRIDVFRRTITENINDSVTETKDSPYHPLGFELGNGLFYDLNENLCLRLDFLLGFSADKNFEIHEMYRSNRKKGIAIYKFFNDTVKVNYMYGGKLHYRYHQVLTQNGMTLMNKKRMLYSIVLNDTSATYSEKMASPRIIQKTGKDQYDLVTRKRKDHVRKEGLDIFLKRDYQLSLSGDKLTMEIRNPKRKRNNVIATLVKNDTSLFIYNKRYSGVKIERHENSIRLYRNEVLWKEYELVNSK